MKMNTAMILCDGGFYYFIKHFIFTSSKKFSLITQTPSTVDGTFIICTEILTR